MSPDASSRPRRPRRPRSDLPRDEGGAALIEAAFVLPVLILVLLGLTEFSLYLWNQGLASKAVQLGIRRAIVSDAVAAGPGLDAADPAYWGNLPPGLRCLPEGGGRGPCPTFAVTCDAATGCRCRGDACRFTYAPARLTPILRAMRAVLPDLRPENVRVTYATSGLGYVGRPGPVPVDVTLSLEGLSYAPLFLGDVVGPSLPLTASAWLPGESLLSR